MTFEKENNHNISDVCIIVVTYNAIAWIDKCLDSCGNYDVVVVDNHSTDNTVHFISKKYPNIHLIKLDSNTGFGKANNIGISFAFKKKKYHYYYLLNQDAYLFPNTIQELVQAHKSNKEYFILSPVHLDGTGQRLDTNFSMYICKSSQLMYDAMSGNLKNIYEVPFVNAAGWLLPKSTILTIGGFNPVFYHYGEDENYCQRVLYHNGKIGIVPHSYMIHDRANREQNILKNPVNLSHFLVRLTNVNHDLKLQQKTQIDLFKYVVKTSISLLIRLKFKLIRILFRKFFHTLGLMKKIKASNEQSKKRQPSFLDI